MNKYTKYINELSRLLAFYENESKRLGGYLQKEFEASVALTNIESDAINYLSKKGMNEKISERLEDVQKVRELIDLFLTLTMRNESLIRECDKMRSAVIKLSEENSSLKDSIEKIKQDISDFNGI